MDAFAVWEADTLWANSHHGASCFRVHTNTSLLNGTLWGHLVK